MSWSERFSPATIEWLTHLERNVLAKCNCRRLGVAVSGGADSVALLLILRMMQERLHFTLSVLHIDHDLRTGSSDDAAWVRALAERLEVPCHQTRLTRPDRQIVRQEGLESWARQQRLAWFARQMQTLPLDAVVLGHHQQDQAETVLWRLLRGCSTAGLSGLRPWRLMHLDAGDLRLWRPLLDTPPSLLRRFLTEAGQDWREDPTNEKPIFLRNRIRHEIIPYLSEFQPQIINHLSLLGSTMRGVHRTLATRAVRHLRSSPAGSLIWKGSPTGPVLRELLRQWWIRDVSDSASRLSSSMVERLEDLLVQKKSGRKVSVGSAQVVRVPSGLELLARADHRSHARVPLLIANPVSCHGQQLILQPVGTTPDPRHLTFWLDTHLVSQGLQVGPPAPGDRFTPKGHVHTRTLARWLIDRKIPRHRRAELCVVACGSEVLWVPETDFRSIHLHEEPGDSRYPISFGWDSSK